MEQDLILKQIVSLEESVIKVEGHENLETLSFHQYNYHRVQNDYKKYLDNIRQCHKAKPTNTKIIKKMLTESRKNYNSIFTYGGEIQRTFNNLQMKEIKGQNLVISHSHYASESLLLAFYFSRKNRNVQVISSRQQAHRGWINSIVPRNQVDTESEFYELIKAQNIGIRYFEEKEAKIEIKQKKQLITIIDIFNLHPTVYRPYIFSEICKGENIILYCSSAQSSDIGILLNSKPTLPSFQIVQISQKFPIEILQRKKPQEQLIGFLKEQSSSPNKQDIIVFHNSHAIYERNISQLINKQNTEILKNINFITGPNQSQKLQVMQGAGDVGNSKIFGSGISVVSNTAETQGELIHPYNNIFIAPNFDTLMQWNYDLSSVFYVFDYQDDQSFHFDYETMIYTESVFPYISLQEYILRLSLVGVNRIGRYCSSISGEIIEFPDQYWYLEDRKTRDLGNYCLFMLKQEFNWKYFASQSENKHLKRCFKTLESAEIIQQAEKKYRIKKNDIIQVISKLPEVNPIYLGYIIDYKNRLYKEDSSKQSEQNCKKMAQLLTIAVSVLMTPGSLRQIKAEKNNNITDRPTALWRQSGYLHSGIDAVVRTKIIDNRANNMGLHQINSKRLTSKQNLSKVNSSEYDIFGSLFQVIQPNRMTFDEMKEQDLIRQQLINQASLHQIIDRVDKICEVLELDDYQFTSFNEISPVIEAMFQHVDRGFGVYSGSRRIGYMLKNSGNGIFPSKSSLIYLLNERPGFIYITRLGEYFSKNGKSKKQILTCNHLNESLFMEIIGELPTNKKSSYGECQLQFHGISSATFTSLWRNSGADIQLFQENNQCFIEPNQEIAMISIHCSKQKSKKVHEQFEKVLQKVKTDLSAQTKVTNYFGNTSIVMGSGGSIQQVIKDQYINKCLLSNLNIDIEQQDLYQLFQQFFTIKGIKINEPDYDKEKKTVHHKSAIIQFVSQKDYYRFYEYYNECLYMDRYIKVSPVQTKPEKTTLISQMSIQCSWSVWKSQSKAMVQFSTPQEAAKCCESMKTRKLYQKIVKFQQKQNKVYLQEMNVKTDEIILQLALKQYGTILNIQILKTPLKQSQNYEDIIVSEIKGLFEEDIVFDVKNFKKLKNGIRQCDILFNDANNLNKVLDSLNGKTDIVGVGKIHLVSRFTYPIIISRGYLNLYEGLLNNALKKMPQNNLLKLEHTFFHQNQYIVTTSPKQQEIDVFKQKVTDQLTGYPIELTGIQLNVVLSEVGIQNLLDLEEKYTCKLLPDFNKKTLLVMTKFENLTKIKEQIKAKVQDNFFYRIPLNHKVFKHFKTNPDVYKPMEEQYHLTLLELEEVGRNILIEGSANHVQNAFNYLMHTIQSISKPTEEMVNADCCGICCEEPFRPYRLQKCGHKFCLSCLIENINITLGDISMFPIKCPQCLAELVIEDLNSLLGTQLWPKLISMAVNQYVGKNGEIITYCFTAGCKQINFINSDYFKCDTCVQTYCLECKLNYHKGLTCAQAKEGGNSAFEKYMKENNIRRCPNDKCKMPIERIDGCYRVTCNRCNKSMCFKCQADKMIAYDNYNDCYKHLNDVHGSYW